MFFAFYTALFVVILYGKRADCQSITDSVKWMNLEDVGEKFLENQKPVMIYFYKNDCDSCRIQETTTFSNPEVSNYINILFYPVKINALTTDTLKFFDGSLYGNSKQTGSIHDLAYSLGVNSDSLPALVLFSRAAQGSVFKGYKSRDEIFRILVYYNENIDQNMLFDEWLALHRKGYPPGQSQIMTRLLVKWKELDEAMEESKTQKRKLLLNLYNYNRVSSTLMRTVCYNNPTVAEYLNEKYYPVNIDVYTKDTLEFFGQKYINENQSHKYHQLPIAALEGKMIFPVFLILDEDLKVLEKITGFISPKRLELILNFYGSDSYKTMPIQDFEKTFKSKMPDD